MTNDKAREYFSAHREGTLEPGLAASLERRMRDDADLRAEYAAFVETVTSLDALRREAIEIPAYLSARIANRLDPVLEARRPSFLQSLLASFGAAPQRGWALGAAGALLVASVALRGLDVRGAHQADLLPVSGESAHWTEDQGGASVAFPGGVARQATVTAEGSDAQSFGLAAGQRFDLKLSNPDREARRFEVDPGDGGRDLVALPGTRPTARHSGTGTVRELASALADAYRLPVVVRGLADDAPVRWNFDGLDARLAAERSLAGKGNATLMEGNVLQLGP